MLWQSFEYTSSLEAKPKQNFIYSFQDVQTAASPALVSSSCNKITKRNYISNVIFDLSTWSLSSSLLPPHLCSQFCLSRNSHTVRWTFYLFCCRELSRNKMKKVDGLAFQGLSALKSLKLQRNSISKLMDGAFWGLSNIEILWVVFLIVKNPIYK